MYIFFCSVEYEEASISVEDRMPTLAVVVWLPQAISVRPVLISLTRSTRYYSNQATPASLRRSGLRFKQSSAP